MNDEISRRDMLIVAFQLEGICNALQCVVQSGAEIGAESRAIVVKLLRDFRGIAMGKVVEGLPDVSDSCNAADLLSIVETLRASALCFLTPHEQSELKQLLNV